MTREEAYNRIDAIIVKYEIDDEYVTITSFLDYDALRMARKLLEQKPCEDEYIKVPKKALKYRTSGMVAYNAEWLKNHFDIERAVLCGEQEPCEDAISRQAVLDLCDKRTKYDIPYEYYEGKKHIRGWDEGRIINFTKLMQLPSVIPQPKTGHWIDTGSGQMCSRCGEIQYGYDNFRRFCASCGAKMIEPQKRKDKE